MKENEDIHEVLGRAYDRILSQEVGRITLKVLRSLEEEKRISPENMQKQTNLQRKKRRIQSNLCTKELFYAIK